VAFALTPDNSLRRRYRLNELSKGDGDDKRREASLQRQLAGTTIVVDARLAGLAAGLLASGVDVQPPAADDGSVWIDVDGRPATGFRVRATDDPPVVGGGDWHESFRFDVEWSEDGEVTRWLAVDGVNEDRRGESSRPQKLTEHQSWAERRARALGDALGLPTLYVDLLALAARLHDEGKRAVRWQRAFNAPRDDIYAKTKGPLSVARLDGYRHEFGSLPYAASDQTFAQYAPDLQDLILHLIAAHHGRARPVIETSGCEDAPPSALAARARGIALRFVRLQKRWGPWGLAWWEALLRAADQQASRENDDRGRTDAGQ
jgi:CRISPR-associated endonuclease/helicase Cas3